MGSLVKMVKMVMLLVLAAVLGAVSISSWSRLTPTPKMFTQLQDGTMADFCKDSCTNVVAKTEKGEQCVSKKPSYEDLYICQNGCAISQIELKCTGPPNCTDLSETFCKNDCKYGEVATCGAIGAS